MIHNNADMQHPIELPDSDASSASVETDVNQQIDTTHAW